MAQLLSPAPPGPPRLSQLLPTVKCSNCNEPVALSELGDHVCKPVPPLPKSPAASTRSMTDLLPTRLQNLVSAPRSQTSQQPPASPSRGGTPANASSGAPSGPAPAQPRSSSLSLGGRNQRPELGPSPLSRGQEPSRVPSPLSARRSPGPPDPRASELVPPNRQRTPSLSIHSHRAGTPSNASQRTISPPSPGRSGGPVAYSPSRVATPVDPRARTLSSPRREYPEPMSSPVIPPARTGTPSAPLVHPPSRTGTPASMRRPSNASAHVPFPSSGPPPQVPRTPSRNQQHMSVLSAYRHPSSPAAYTPPPPPPSAPIPPTPGTPHVEDIDTKIGGEAGMAGVGRRGFAAAARAAMFATNITGQTSHTPSFATPGMDGRRPNAPKFLDISTAPNVLHAANTPPLSPNPSTHSSTHSPHSPYSPTSFPLATPGGPSSPSRPAAGPAIASSRTPSPSTLSQIDRLTQTPTPTPADYAKQPQTPTTPMTPSGSMMPFFEKFKNKMPLSPSVSGFGLEHKETSRSPSPDPESGSEYSGSGLAYADETDEEERGLIASPTVKPLAAKDNNQVRFPSLSEKSTAKLGYSGSTSSSGSSGRRPSSPPRADMPMRSISDASRSSARASTKGGLEHAMETLFEDPMSPTTSTASTSYGVAPGLTKSNTTSNRGSSVNAVKLPTRSHTSPTLHTHALGESSKKRERKTRVCVRCERRIDDGRWVRMDMGKVMCERCWKNMYLPKCRRCNLPIEKHAVSSSDGQLKGKYHRECFNCHTCHKPFPDKTFYVFDGKPFCAYHYHEANDSLCAAATCGQPIEGPCAVSHAGDRYHPEHLLCEHPRGCTERLEEYYEVDGRMLCERHAFMGHSEDDEDEDDERERRAMKRTTRFIDLAQLGGSGLR